MEIHCKFHNTIIALLPSDQKFINICETFEALGRFKENTIDLSFFDQEAFQHLRQKVSQNIPIPLNKDILIKITEIASFLNISESNLLAILQNAQISMENVEEFLPFIHRLLTRGYPNIAKECSIQGRLPLQLLNDQTISYNKFKKAFRKAKCLYEYKVKVLAKCYCSKCTEFRSKNKWFDPENTFKEENYVPCFKMRGNLLKF